MNRFADRVVAICIVLVSLPQSACIPQVDAPITSAPCPCPAGYACCNEACVNDTVDCEENSLVYNSDAGDAFSSNAPCETDSNCPQEDEVCVSWKTEDGNLNGPKRCRKRCTEACRESEICELVLHDGKALESVNVALACVDEDPFEGCDPVGCRDCADAPFGSTVCNSDNNVEGCFIALDVECGLYCRNLVVEECGENACGEDVDGAYCSVEPSRSPNLYETWCGSNSCEQCAEMSLSPGETACIEGASLSCLFLPFPSDVCEEEDACACDALCSLDTDSPYDSCD